MASRSDIALVLVDMVLPGGVSGAELVSALRVEARSSAREQNSLRHQLAVLFMTGYSNDAVSSDPLIHDVRLLAKPFSEAALATAVAEALRDAGSQAHSA